MQMAKTAVDEMTRREIEDLLTTFGDCADRANGGELAELFVDDGTLIMGTQQARGRLAIMAFTTERFVDPARKTRHVWSNLKLVTTADAQLQAASIQQTFEQIGADQPAQIRVSDVTDEFVRDAGGSWRFMSRRISRVFTVSASRF